VSRLGIATPPWIHRSIVADALTTLVPIEIHHLTPRDDWE
jgi:hypothetical protein